MREIIFVTGGQRSGKSRFARKLAEEYSANPLFLATARRWDDDFEQRIRRHRDERGAQWETLEEEKRLSALSLAGRTVLLDCVTLWLTNIFHDSRFSLDAALKEAKTEWDNFIEQDFRLIAVSNEIGMGVHAPGEASRHFADLQGWVNQHIAQSADRAYVMLSGIPLQLK
jgi:adenosylcobinamide kinase/adenosylcobinamide-phosphate guanylyltransferase